MNPLDTLKEYELWQLLKSKRTEICSIEDPFMLLSLLRDRDIIPEDKYKAITALEDRRELSKAIYKLLEGMDVTNGPNIRDFWNVLFEDCILSQYPQLQHLYDSLSRCDDSKTKPLGLHTRVPPTVTAQHSVRKHCEAQTENVRDFRFSEQSDSEGADRSHLKRDAETHAEGSSAKRVQEDNKSLKKTRPLPIKKSPNIAAVKRELSQTKQTLATVKRELGMVKKELVMVKRELKSANHKLSAINQPRRAAPVTDPSASQAGQQAEQSAVKTLADVPLNKISDEEEARIYNDNFNKCDKYALQIFKSLVNSEILRQWAGHVNYNGNRGRKGVPRNVINAVNAYLGRRFPGIGKLEEQAISNQINGFLRRPNAAFQR